MTADEIAEQLIAALRALRDQVELDGDLAKCVERSRGVLLLFDPAYDDEEETRH
jgi:hypothetical protein